MSLARRARKPNLCLRDYPAEVSPLTKRKASIPRLTGTHVLSSLSAALSMQTIPESIDPVD